jgi:hypothetical protein
MEGPWCCVLRRLQCLGSLDSRDGDSAPGDGGVRELSRLKMARVECVCCIFLYAQSPFRKKKEFISYKGHDLTTSKDHSTQA